MGSDHCDVERARRPEGYDERAASGRLDALIYCGSGVRDPAGRPWRFAAARLSLGERVRVPHAPASAPYRHRGGAAKRSWEGRMKETYDSHRRGGRFVRMRRSGAARRQRRPRPPARRRILSSAPAPRHAAGHLQDDQRQQVHALPSDGTAGASGRPHPRYPAGDVLGGGSSVNAQVYMRGRPSDYEEWHEICAGKRLPGWGWADVLPHFRAWRETTGSTTSGMARTGRCWSPIRSHQGPLPLVRPGGPGSGRALQPRLQRADAARRGLLPIHEPARKAQQRGLRVHRAARRRPQPDRAPERARAPIVIENGRAVGVTYRGKGARPSRLRRQRGHPRRRLSRHPATAHAVRHRAGRSAESHGIPAWPTSRGRGEPGRPPGSADGRHGEWKARLLPAGRRDGGCPQRLAVQAVRHRADHVGRGGGGRIRQPERSGREPTIQAFCVPIVYLDRDTSTSSRTPTGSPSPPW